MTLIDATDFVNEWSENPEHFSDSVANSGLDNIGQVTWKNAMEYMSDEKNWLFNDSDFADDVRAHFREYGAWEKEEIEGWGMQELNAMLAQEVASDMMKDESEQFRFHKEKDKYYIQLGM